MTLLFGPLGPSLAGYVRSSKTLSRWLKPVSICYANLAGYRRIGLKYDDLLVEERDDVQKALGRLSTREAYDRAFRIKQASQASVLHQDLPKDKWLSSTEDKRYLKPRVLEVTQEDLERQKWDNLTVSRHR